MTPIFPDAKEGMRGEMVRKSWKTYRFVKYILIYGIIGTNQRFRRMIFLILDPLENGREPGFSCRTPRRGPK